MKFWEFKNAGADVDELHITGDIVDDDRVWLYEWFGDPCTSPNAFREELNKCKAKNLNVWIDSYGGSVFAAAGIYNALKAFKGHVTTIVDGKAMSAGSVIAMAGETVKMSPVGILMIHNPLTSVSGYASELRKAADVLDVVKNTIINAYVLKTGNKCGCKLPLYRMDGYPARLGDQFQQPRALILSLESCRARRLHT